MDIIFSSCCCCTGSPTSFIVPSICTNYGDYTLDIHNNTRRSDIDLGPTK